MKLTIAIPSVINRSHLFNLLVNHINKQKTEEVELITHVDNKQLSIGAKRQKLIDQAKGEYLVMIDDDDWIPEYFVSEILKAIEKQPDCIGYLEHCTFNGKNPKTGIFSLQFQEWGFKHPVYNHVRTPFFKTPIKTEICRKVECKDMRFGEDHDFAVRIYPHLKTEVFIPMIMYNYRHWQENHNVKYGIK